MVEKRGGQKREKEVEKRLRREKEVEKRAGGKEVK